MPDPTCRALLTLVAAVALLVPGSAVHSTGAAPPAPDPRWGELVLVDGGYGFRASLHDSRLVVTRVGDRVRFHDRALRRWLPLPAGCRRIVVERGIAASCAIPDSTTPLAPLLLEIRPRAGDDRVDGSALGAEFRLEVYGADGNDLVFAGAGSDFVNGAAGGDIAFGGPGEDQLVGTSGADQLAGNGGEDQLEGGVGNDVLYGGPAADTLLCGDGVDTTDDDGESDLVRRCELVA